MVSQSSLNLIGRAAVVCLVSVVMLSVDASSADAQITSEQRRELSTLRRDVAKIASLIRRKNYDEATQAIADSEKTLGEIMTAASLTADDRAIAAVQKVIDIQKNILAKASGMGPGKQANLGVSFSKQVAPILNEKCMGCHDDTARGGLRLDTFAGIRRGGSSGPLLVPGNPQRSLLAYRLVAPGQQRMPRGGQPLPPAEMKIIGDWISQGARYDHTDESTQLADLGRAAAMDKPEVKVAKPDGTETVSFEKDIAPMFTTFCVGCHSGNNPASGFSMETFEDILIGGDSGEVLIPGDLENSRLFRLTGGLENPRMPQGQARITRKNYEDLKAWISEGIKYDLDDPKMRLRDIVPTDAEVLAMKLRQMSESEFREHRQSKATGHWKRTLSSAKPITVTTEQFLVMGNVELSRLEQTVGWAESAVSELQKTFGLKTAPSWRGRLAIYVFEDRYDYDEFNRSIENRPPADTLFGHAKVAPTFDDAYVAVLDTGDVGSSQKPPLQWTLFKAITSAHLQASGSARPAWLLEGSGWAIANPTIRNDEFARSMVGSSVEVLEALRRPEDLFANGTFAPDATEHVGYVTTRFLLSSGSPEQFRQFVALVMAGRNVNEACRAVYNATSNELAVSVLRALK